MLKAGSMKYSEMPFFQAANKSPASEASAINVVFLKLLLLAAPSPSLFPFPFYLWEKCLLKGLDLSPGFYVLSQKGRHSFGALANFF